MINPIPMGSGCDDSKPKSERDFARLVSKSASCCDLGLKSNPPPMKPVNHVNQISPQIGFVSSPLILFGILVLSGICIIPRPPA